MKKKDSRRLFADYDLSVRMKKLGFKERCWFAFDNCSTPMRCTDLRTDEQQIEGVNYNSSTYTSQPLYQQIVDWLREEHNTWISVECGSEYIQVWKIVKTGHLPKTGEAVDYYQSLKEAINEALNLVEAMDFNIIK